ncbi:putative pectinesterase/pectinesterase inhibitor 34-like [Dorcoceras hygrometricum]|uniref:Pectinesterase n=1 Tax=Dorcoceras hygrometricum TaxID=472368 RepID=A0A2Z7ACF4_9LAMI|nr:putative pectinesterase/pectinesterase inhibitor 34-like [Dorcoceras hygrometricum]
MEYGRLGKPEPLGTSNISHTNEPCATPKKRKVKFLLILTSTLIVASAISAAVVVVTRSNHSSSSNAAARLKIRRPSQAISRTCGLTRYPTLCVDSLVDFPHAMAASEKDLVHISVNVTLRKFDRAISLASNIRNLVMDSHVRSAYEDCIELLEDSVSHLTRSLSSVAPGGGVTTSTQDVLTWLSAALTNHGTCTEGFSELKGHVKHLILDVLKDLSGLVSNCLAIYSASGAGGQAFYGIPIQNRRRMLLSSLKVHQNYPQWLSRRDRKLLDSPVSGINAHVTVSKDGSGNYETIAEAIKRAPENSRRRFIIYVKAGRYEEGILTVGRKKTNIMLIGDGKGRTVISGSRNIQEGVTTFRSATFAATGDGFIARDITFENTAGPSKHQAVALRVGADHAVIFRCSVVGYQDTLYVYSQRQFYRDSDIHGTVDFIFGNAAVVFQNCNIHARKPMPFQKITITAQNRQDPNQNTGMSFHACRLVADPDLQSVKGSYPTYLGRPWKLYSRVVYMLSYMGDHIHPKGWLEWSSTFALDTLHYGEYMNYGPGGATGQRVKWPGYHVITSPAEASKFTVGKFIYGSAWLPSTGVSFAEGLST